MRGFWKAENGRLVPQSHIKRGVDLRDVFVNKNYAPLTEIIEKAMKAGIEKARGPLN